MTDPSTAKIKNVSGEALTVPWLGGRLVLDGQVVEVPVEDVHAFTQQAATWAPQDNAAKQAHKEADEQFAEDRLVEAAEQAAAFDPDLRPEVDAMLEQRAEPDPLTPAAPAGGHTPTED